MWSIGCIFGELILREPLLPGRGEIDQVSKVSITSFLDFCLRKKRSDFSFLRAPDLQTPRATNGRDVAWFPTAAERQIVQPRSCSSVSFL